jgi:hypothetical protein
MIRTAHFNRKRFNNVELHDWCKRTKARVIRVEYKKEKVKVTYR